MNPRSHILIGTAVAITQFALFVLTLSHSPAEGSHRAYEVALGVLGAPLLYLRYVPPFTPGSHDVAVIFSLAGANALLWGAMVSVVLSRWQRRA